MTTALFTHPSSRLHVTPPGHPERVARIDAILAALEAEPFANLIRMDAPRASVDDVIRAHPRAYYDQMATLSPDQGFRSLDVDTHLSPGSLDAALHGLGANVAMVDAVLTGDVTNAFAAIRPPGHHAEKATPMGFCLFGNIAIAAKHALAAHGLDRVAIVDFDVHHGNGTQDIVWDDPGILFISSHQMPLFPGTGAPDERGAHDNVLNLPLRAGQGGDVFRDLYERQAFPRLQAFQPDLILVSAGFDAHAADPLAHLILVEEDFAWVTHRLCDMAEELCDRRIVSTLEGGYDLTALAASVAVHVSVLMERGA